MNPEIVKPAKDVTPLPCPNPWCGHYNRRTIRTRPYDLTTTQFWVRCACGVCGPISTESREKAVAAWNTRTDSKLNGGQS